MIINLLPLFSVDKLKLFPLTLCTNSHSLTVHVYQWYITACIVFTEIQRFLTMKKIQIVSCNHEGLEITCACPSTQNHTKSASMSTCINTREDCDEKGGALMMHR